MAAEPSRAPVDIAGAPAETTADVPRRPQCCSEPPLGLVALVQAAGRSRLVAARGRARRPAEPLLEVRRVAPMTSQPFTPTVPPPAGTPARAADRARAPRRPAHARGGVPPRPPSRAGLPAGVGRARPAGRALLLHGRRLRAARSSTPRADSSRCAARWPPRRRRPGRPAALLRRGRRLPRLRRGLGLRAERAAAARARRRRRRARPLPLRARRRRVRPRAADAAGRRPARLRPGRGRALRRPARARCPPASSRCRR